MELACSAEPEEVQDQVDLAGQHGQARMRDAAPGGRLVQQSRLLRAGHDVADQGARRESAHRDRERVTGPHTQRGGVDHYVMTGRIRRSDGPATATGRAG